MHTKVKNLEKEMREGIAEVDTALQPTDDHNQEPRPNSLSD